MRWKVHLIKTISLKRGTMRIPPKIEIRNNEINARNLSFFLLIVSILLLLNLCLDMTNGLLAFWTILTNLYKKTPLMLWVRISSRAMCTTLCNKVCQWLATGLVVFSGYSDVIHHTTARYNWNIVENGVSHLY
jgi:hypothetical protein